MKWTIEYENDTGRNDQYFDQWWIVSDGEKSFTCDSEEDAIWLCNTLNDCEE